MRPPSCAPAAEHRPGVAADVDELVDAGVLQRLHQAVGRPARITRGERGAGLQVRASAASDQAVWMLVASVEQMTTDAAPMARARPRRPRAVAWKPSVVDRLETADLEEVPGVGRARGRARRAPKVGQEYEQAAARPPSAGVDARRAQHPAARGAHRKRCGIPEHGHRPDRSGGVSPAAAARTFARWRRHAAAASAGSGRRRRPAAAASSRPARRRRAPPGAVVPPPPPIRRRCRSARGRSDRAVAAAGRSVAHVGVCALVPGTRLAGGQVARGERPPPRGEPAAHPPVRRPGKHARPPSSLDLLEAAPRRRRPGPAVRRLHGPGTAGGSTTRSTRLLVQQHAAGVAGQVAAELVGQAVHGVERCHVQALHAAQHRAQSLGGGAQQVDVGIVDGLGAGAGAGVDQRRLLYSSCAASCTRLHSRRRARRRAISRKKSLTTPAEAGTGSAPRPGPGPRRAVRGRAWCPPPRPGPRPARGRRPRRRRARDLRKWAGCAGRAPVPPPSARARPARRAGVAASVATRLRGRAWPGDRRRSARAVRWSPARGRCASAANRAAVGSAEAPVMIISGTVARSTPASAASKSARSADEVPRAPTVPAGARSGSSPCRPAVSRRRCAAVWPRWRSCRSAALNSAARWAGAAPGPPARARPGDRRPRRPFGTAPAPAGPTARAGPRCRRPSPGAAGRIPRGCG